MELPAHASSTFNQGSARLKHQVDAAKSVFDFDYDPAGRLRTQTTTAGRGQGLDEKTIIRSFTYDPRGAIETATVTAPGTATDGLVVTLHYDSLGNPISEDTGGYLPLAVRSVYNAQSRLVSTVFDGSNAPAMMRGGER